MAFIPIAEMRQRFGFTQRGGLGGDQSGGSTFGSVFPSGTGGFAGFFNSLFSQGLLSPGGGGSFQGQGGRFQSAPDLLAPLKSRATEGPLGIGEFTTLLSNIIGRNQGGGRGSGGSFLQNPGNQVTGPSGLAGNFPLGSPQTNESLFDSGSEFSNSGIPPPGSTLTSGIGAPLKTGPGSAFAGDDPKAVFLRQMFFGPNNPGRFFL